jgi:hypothetical protein
MARNVVSRPQSAIGVLAGRTSGASSLNLSTSIQKQIEKEIPGSRRCSQCSSFGDQDKELTSSARQRPDCRGSRGRQHCVDGAHVRELRGSSAHYLVPS